MPVFPPFYMPHRTQEILKRSYLSQGVIFWSKIRYRGSKRQSEYSRREYVALPVVSGVVRFGTERSLVRILLCICDISFLKLAELTEFITAQQPQPTDKRLPGEVMVILKQPKFVRYPTQLAIVVQRS